MIKSRASQWEQWAECDTCHTQTPVFIVSIHDNRLFDYLCDLGWKRYFPPWAKTHADEMIMCGECIQVADTKDGVPNV